MVLTTPFASTLHQWGGLELASLQLFACQLCIKREDRIALLILCEERVSSGTPFACPCGLFGDRVFSVVVYSPYISGGSESMTLFRSMGWFCAVVLAISLLPCRGFAVDKLLNR